MKTKGAILIAKNNGKIDYIKQAIFLANRIKKYLEIPVSVITDNIEYLNKINNNTVFDNVIEIKSNNVGNHRRFYDGAISSYDASFRNESRFLAYELSPYDETLLLDTDFIISNGVLKKCFESELDFLIYKKSSDIAKVRDEHEFNKISNYSIDFYWATVVFFKKTSLNKIFFDLVNHIQDEWIHYKRVYQLDSALFRNDFAFSIAIHIMNGFQQGDFASSLPGTNIYSTDKDILWKINDDELTFLVEKKDQLGEYTLLKTKGQNIHVMNKFSLERIIDSELTND
jgi:hypothetical protein